MRSLYNICFSGSCFCFTLFGNVLEDFFGLQHQCTLTEATLITINRSLDAIFSNTYGYDIVNPYSGSSGTYHRNNATFGDMLADMNNSIATLGTRYLSTLVTNSNGISSLVTDIKTNTTNSAASDLALLTLVGDQVNIDWKNSTAEYVGVYDSNGNLLNNNTTYSFTDYYIAFTGFHNDRDSITKVNIPLSAWSSNPYVKSVSVYSGVGTGKVSELYYFVETSASTGLNVYFTPAMPYSAVYIRVTVNGNFHTITPGLSYIQYIPNTSEDYFKIYDFIIQYNLLQKESNINVEINDSVNVTPIALDVQIGINDFTEVNTISNKLRTWLSTGVGVSALIGALDQLDDSFFTLHNRSVIETINLGYTDFYD